MIHIKRDGPPDITVFTKQTVSIDDRKITRAQRELDAAVAFFTSEQNYANGKKISRESFDFEVYKDKELRRRLADIFGKKCAYCESEFAAMMPGDVEHFRPKSAVELEGGESLEPGYFWLAGDWDNLLISCNDCNRSRKHNPPRQTRKMRFGKGAQFPLGNEARRVRSPARKVADEDPDRLLINPCVDDPEKLLRYDDDGVVHPLVEVRGRLRDMARYSIDVYALQRGDLVERRRGALARLIFQIQQLRRAVTDFGMTWQKGATAAELEDRRDQLRELRQYFIDHMGNRAEYLGLMRDYIRRTRASGGFDDLIRAGIDPDTLVGQ